LRLLASGVWCSAGGRVQRVKADCFAPKLLKLVGEGQSYRAISHRLGLSKNTILDIVKRDRAP
jgi:putative DNA-invertase from lambdoid prophage Rac